MSRSPKNPIPPTWERILQGRDFSPFLASVGLDTGSGATRLREGKFPDPQILIPAIRLERISLSWLVDERGAPFMVMPTVSDEDAASLIATLLQDEPTQTVTLVRTTAAGKHAVILTQPAQLVRGRHVFDYIAVEVLSGPIGPLALEAIAQNATGKLRVLYMEQEGFTALATGQMGNVPLIGWARQPGGLLDTAIPIEANVLTHNANRVAQDQAPYFALPLDADTHELGSIFKNLDPTTRATILTMIRALKPATR